MGTGLDLLSLWEEYFNAYQDSVGSQVEWESFKTIVQDSFIKKVAGNKRFYREREMELEQTCRTLEAQYLSTKTLEDRTLWLTAQTQ